MNTSSRLTAAIFATCVCTWGPQQAWGNEQLIDPPLRDNTNQKIRPCGGVGWGSHVTALKPGAALTMQWVETIHHPGWFRISFRASETGDFNQTILAAQVDSMTGIDDYTHTVTMPQVLTDQGSVQLSFVMTDQPNNTMPYGYNEYSNCADVVLTDDPNAVLASPTPTPTASASGSPSGPSIGAAPEPNSTISSGTVTSAAGNSNGTLPVSDNINGGCATGPALAPWWVVGALAARRRRRASRK